jgi:hypothetical protein
VFVEQAQRLFEASGANISELRRLHAFSNFSGDAVGKVDMTSGAILPSSPPARKPWWLDFAIVNASRSVYRSGMQREA